MADTLTITDNRTGKTVRDPDPGRHDPRDGSAPDQGRPRRVRDDDLRPGVHEHRRLPQPDHVHRRRQGHPALSRLPDRAAGRAQRLPRDRLPDSVRRAADDRRSSSSGRSEITRAHDAPREHQEVPRGLPLRRAPDGHVPQRGRRAVDVLSRRARTSSIRRRAGCRRSGSSPRCRASPPTPSATPSAARTCFPTTS